MIKRLSKAMGTVLVSNSFSPIPLKISIHIKKKSDWSLPKIYTYLTLELCQYHNSGSMFHQVSRLLQAATAANCETPCVCACLSDPCQTLSSSAREQPQELGSCFCPLNL